MITDFELPERNSPLNIAAHTFYPDQFAFQKDHAIGRVLNIGANTDGAEFWKRGGINVDLFDIDPVTKANLPVHIIADARWLPDGLYRRFDTVVLGEILEHMEPEDAVKALKQAVHCLKHVTPWLTSSRKAPTQGRVIITIPHDGRREGGTLEIPEHSEYAAGIHAFHYRKIERAELFDWLKQADLEPIFCAEIRYPWDGVVGSGVVAVER
jgi:SAM-dependent methyltransferase